MTTTYSTESIVLMANLTATILARLVHARCADPQVQEWADTAVKLQRCAIQAERGKLLAGDAAWLNVTIPALVTTIQGLGGDRSGLLVQLLET